MKKALVIYHSKTGITRKLGHEIGIACYQNNLQTEIISIYEFSKDVLEGVDYIFLGCWTHGLMILLQHPEQHWVKFANSLPALNSKKIVLFTTYKLATGSMFKNMRKHIHCESSDIVLEIKSRNGNLQESDVFRLKSIITS